MACQTKRRLQQTDHGDHPIWLVPVEETFGLKVPSEIFQRKLGEALGGLEGVFSVVDDVVIAGCGQRVEEAQIDNQRKLTETLKRCAKKNIALNEDKQQTSLTEITFHGYKITWHSTCLGSSLTLMKPLNQSVL